MPMRKWFSEGLAALSCSRRRLHSNAADSSGDLTSLPDLSLRALVTIPVVVFVINLATIYFGRFSDSLTTIWSPNAVILAALIQFRRSPRNCSLLFAVGAVGMAAANFTAQRSPSLAAILTGANIGEVAVALALLSYFRIDASNLTRFGNLLIFVVIAALVPIGTDTITALALGSLNGIPWPEIWSHSYPAHILGLIIIVPFLVCVMSDETLPVKSRPGEAVLVLALFIGFGIVALYFRFVVFLIVPAILFATVRFGIVGATISNLVTVVISSSIVLSGLGTPIFQVEGIPERILGIQVLMLCTALWSLPIAALLKERDILLADLSLANTQLKAESDTKSHLVVGLRRRLSSAEEKERLRLSHELHDQAGQGLIAAILELNEIDPLIRGAARERLYLVRKKMEELGKTLHHIAWELRPPAIDELGLKRALASYIADWSEQCNIEVDFHGDDANLDDVPSDISTAVYRVVQEGLTNIVKHARQPSNVSVVVRRAGAVLQVIVEDNGCGFDVGAATARAGGHRGLGLDGMSERLMLVGGTLEIESAPGAGTTLFARIALDGQRSVA
jgi:signal transduction histidine kinase